ncbi:MAG: pyridoxine 5'-phosphate synthase [Bacteroidetes bacterium]|nr:pyridoxine 5'-phosphate synthase [Bacteroidota bacterium]
MTRLLINIDHVATLRNARRETFPDPLSAARACLDGGADGIVFHLREDRRHIKDADVERIRAELDTKLDFELSLAEEIVAICCRNAPELATLVPERREEVTTEGGLDVLGNSKRLSSVIPRLYDHGVAEVALFVDPDPEQIEAAARSGANAIELHTGDYANAADAAARAAVLSRLATAARQAHDLGLRVHAGHGLDIHNYPAFSKAVPHLAEVSIGFAIVSRALFIGFKAAVEEMRSIIEAHPHVA